MRRPTWQAEPEPELPPIGRSGWVRVVWRGVALGVVTFGGLAILLLMRLLERPIFGVRRPVTPFITQFVCSAAFVIMGIRLRQTGTVMEGQGAVVSNHASWLDIFALNARQRIYFVSKSEVAGWPAIGWLARATGTVFISRNARDSAAQKKLFEQRLEAGHKLLFFPEGTSTDGRRVLGFKSTLFSAFFRKGLKETLRVQPVTIIYRAPKGEDPRFYGWWGDMEFGAHFLHILAAARHGSVEVAFHPPVRVADFEDRKALARQCEEVVRSGLPADVSALREGAPSAR